MISKKYLLLLLILPIFLLSLTTTSVPAPFPSPVVKVWVDQPAGYIPFVAPGGKITIDLMIETYGFSDFAPPPALSIMGWGLDLRIDPAVISINTTTPDCPPPPLPCFPPPLPDAKVAGALPGYVMYEFNVVAGGGTPGPYPPSLLPGSANPVTGFWDEVAEIITVAVPPPGGFGDYMTQTLGIKKLVTFEVESKSNTQGSLIDLIDVEWRDPNNVWHPVDVVVDGYYGGPPPIQPGYMSAVGSGPIEIPLNNPIGTMWHELYPSYSHMWEIIDWTENGDGILSASDQIEMVNETGWIYAFHVDAVTTTIHWTFKPDDVNPTGENASAEPDEPHSLSVIMEDPVGSYWHQIYPDYSKQFKITSWDDNSGAPDTDPNGVFDPSDQFDFIYEDDPGTTHWAHLDAVSTDIIISQKGDPWKPDPEFPLGVVLMMAIAPAIPIVYLWRLRKKVVTK